MKILERREPPPERPLITACGHCRSVVEFERKEMDPVRGLDGGVMRYRAACPVCGRAISVHEPCDFGLHSAGVSLGKGRYVCGWCENVYQE